MDDAGAGDQPLQHIIVMAEDNRKFKMVMRGNLSRLAVAKIKRYLEKSTGVPPEKQILTYQGQLLADDMVGRDFGLVAEGTFNLAFAQGWGPNGKIPDSASGSGVGPLEQDLEGRGRQRVAVASMDSVRMPPPSPSSQPAVASSPATTYRSYPQGHTAAADRYTPPPSSAVSHPFPQHQAFHSSSSHPGARDDDSHSRMARMTSPRAGGPPPAFDSLPTPAPFGAAAAAHRSHPLDVSGGGFSSVVPPQAGEPAHPLASKLHVLEDENRALRAEIERLRRHAEQNSTLHVSSIATPGQSVVAAARANLHELGKEIGQHLAFDDSLSCVVGADEQNTIVLTVDPPTERLYLYSTLLTSLPREPAVRLRLFESLLEWSMLGRDVAGGSMGICPRSGIAMLSTSIDLRHSTATALRDVAPVFIECLVRWRKEALAVVANSIGPLRRAPSPPRSVA